MAPKHALILVAGAALLFATVGAVAGGLLGRLIPNYYRSVFPGSDSPYFDPIAVGIGQGLGQGLVLGAVVGLILVGYHMFAARRTVDTGNVVPQNPLGQAARPKTEAEEEQQVQA